MPEQIIIGGVPKVGFGVHTCPFPGSLYSVLEYLGDKQPYDYLEGVTGACFRRLFEKNDGGNVDLMYLGQEPVRRAFQALNYDYTWVAGDDNAGMREAIKRSITDGKPAVAFGVIGPPEAGVVTGFSENGHVLHGWSYFQEGDTSSYYAQPDWEGNTFGVVVLEGKKSTPPPSKRAILRSSLEWAVLLARNPTLGDLLGDVPNAGHACGLAAYHAWADALEVDADYPPGNAEVMGIRTMVHGDQCMMLEERGEAAGYLRRMAGVAPEAKPQLLAAADLYERTLNLMPRIWMWSGDYGPEAQQGLANPTIRHGVAAAVREAGDTEEMAMEQVEAALAAMQDS